MFVSDKPLQPSIMFADKARAQPSEAEFQMLHSRVGPWPGRKDARQEGCQAGRMPGRKDAKHGGRKIDW